MLAYRSLHGTASSDHLDLVRGLAALAVMLGHLRKLFFVDSPEIRGHSNLLLEIMYFATGFGHEAVMIFFVLSGFLVGGSVLRGRMDGEWSWRPYATNRLTRLWVVLIPALLLGAIWDRSGIFVFGTHGIYGGLVQNHVVQFVVRPRLSGTVMLGNALFLQGILTPTFGTNGPLWSLSFEFWYYVLFPLVVLAFPAWKVGWSAILYATAATLIAFFIGESMSIYFLIWLLGAAINLAPTSSGRLATLWIGVATAALLSLLAVLKFKPGFTEYPHDFVVAVASVALIYALLRSSARSTSGFYSRAAHRLAGFSYTLYVVHLPALAFMSAWLAGRRWQPDSVHIVAGAALAICILAYAFVIAQFTEYRTSEVRARVTAVIGLNG
jgi:peptidoglycan/LPS O-acetylase OafA/YrhL